MATDATAGAFRLVLRRPLEIAAVTGEVGTRMPAASGTSRLVRVGDGDAGDKYEGGANLHLDATRRGVR